MTWPLADRFAPLLHKLHVESTMTLITFKVEASFGFLFDAGVVGKAEARVAGSLGLEIPFTVSLDAIIGSGAANGKGSDVVDDVAQRQDHRRPARHRGGEGRHLDRQARDRHRVRPRRDRQGRVELHEGRDEVLAQRQLARDRLVLHSTDIKTDQAKVSRHTDHRGEAAHRPDRAHRAEDSDDKRERDPRGAGAHRLLRRALAERHPPPGPAGAAADLRDLGAA